MLCRVLPSRALLGCFTCCTVSSCSVPPSQPCTEHYPPPLRTAAAGYAVYKSTPLGDVSAILPYLARRAAENRTVARGTRSERRLLASELLRRLGIART